MGRALIVSAGASSNEYIAARLTEMGYSRPVIIPSGAEARRRMTESDFDRRCPGAGGAAGPFGRPAELQH